MKLSEQLRAARAHIEQPGTWNAGDQDRRIGGVMTHCALGAIGAAYAYHHPANEKLRNALYQTLLGRHHTGNLPTPTYGSSMSNATAWDKLFGMGPTLGSAVIAQFNNSTSQADVLALFDEAIADAERDEQPELPLEIVNLLNTLPVKELADA